MPASSYRQRVDGPPAVLVLPVQAKSTDLTAQPDKGPKPPGGPGKGLGTDVPPPPGIPSKGPGETGFPGMPKPTQDPYEAYIRLEAPGREKLFGSRDTERELEERMRQERRDTGQGDPIQFPEKPKLTEQPYEPRKFAPLVEIAEPNYVVYRRLYFEELNSERYGWDLGPAQPVVSTLYFFKDVLLLPHNFASYPCRRFETSAGYCLPGDPVPYILYPPELTWTGVLAEVGAGGLMTLVFP
jgi:hypothetical protein